MENCYNILGVDKNASQNEIKKRFRELTLEHHPDKSKSEDADDEYLRIRLAYETLSDTEKRKSHDIQIYGTNESYTKTSTEYSHIEFTPDQKEKIVSEVIMHGETLLHIITEFYSRFEHGPVSINLEEHGQELFDWYKDIDNEMYSYCKRITLMIPMYHEDFMKEVKKIQKICRERVETMTTEFYPRIIEIKKGGSLSPSQSLKYSTTFDYKKSASLILETSLKNWLSVAKTMTKKKEDYLGSYDPGNFASLVTYLLDYPRYMQITKNFIDDWIDNLILMKKHESGLQKKLKQPKEVEPKKVTEEDHTVTFADEY